MRAREPAMPDSMVRTASSRSRWRRRSAHNYPRRAPVAIASQTSVPHASSFHASLSSAAASFADGGDGLGAGDAGGCALPVGLMEIQRQRTATFHGTREDPVDLPDGRRRQWTTDVRFTAVVALVLGLCLVIDLPAPLVAAGTAAPELGVERVEHLAVELAQRQRSEDRAHVPLEVADVGLP